VPASGLSGEDIERCPTATHTTTPSAQTFAALLERARKHDKAAITTLYERALPPIYRYVFARVTQRDLIEDIVAEIFLEMVESLPTLHADHEAGFFAWLFSIARTKLYRMRQKQARSDAWHTDLSSGANEVELDLPALDIASNPAAWHEWREILHELGLALDSLTAEQQYVVIGRFLAGQTIEDLAQALAKQPGTIRALQFRALRTLAKRLAPQSSPILDHHKGGGA
jgi:RNA polymerase sigma-70 factor, ECF subfamily